MGKHLNLSQRILIESNLNENTSLRKIGIILGKPHTTISREILTRRVLSKGNRFNNFNVKCDKTNKAPFVCNGCPNKNQCRKNKYFYYAKDANDNYRTTLVESRQGIDFENDEFRKMDKIIKEEVDKGHSFYMIVLDIQNLILLKELYIITKKKVIYLVKILTCLELLDIAKEKEWFLKTRAKEKKMNVELTALIRTLLNIKKLKK